MMVKDVMMFMIAVLALGIAALVGWVGGDI